MGKGLSERLEAIKEQAEPDLESIGYKKYLGELEPLRDFLGLSKEDVLARYMDSQIENAKHEFLLPVVEVDMDGYTPEEDADPFFFLVVLRKLGGL